MVMRPLCILFLSFICFNISLDAQTIVKGTVRDGVTGEDIIGANIIVQGLTEGTISDWDGTFEFTTERSYPITLEISYIGYAEQVIELTDDTPLDIKLEESTAVIQEVVVKGQRVSDAQKKAPLTIESLDLLSIKETPAASFYEGLGALKDVDLTTASIGFTIINTRGFNSTSPVRSLQIIDGVDNQSPGLNFSLGNFLGSSELDVRKVDLIIGASSAYYGPNAFNGVLSIETKNPFILRGLSARFKVAERNLFEGSLRWADSFNNKEGLPWVAYKFNLFRLTADDWEADNFNPVDDSEVGIDNPGRFDAVNIYGDEFSRSASILGLGTYFRSGYIEEDLVDYDTENTKASGAVHFRLKPTLEYDSPELILASSYGAGTTVFQGDNRFSLRNIQFFQHKVELTKRDKYFLRGYVTHEDAGDSYDPFFTALQLQDRAKDDTEWNTDYLNYWSINILPRINQLEGAPTISMFPGDPDGFRAAQAAFIDSNQDIISEWHQETLDAANSENPLSNTGAFLVPGTPEFQAAFDDITSRIANSEGGTRFFDKSALAHLHGEYSFKDVYANNKITDLDFKLGANGRYYFPNSQGSILLDTAGVNIDTYEFGVYGGAELGLAHDKLRLTGTIRLDKHENFEYLVSPAASLVWEPSDNNYLRVSFSSAVRNPTLTDQYLNYNVGPAILLGNLDGFNDLTTVDSFVDFLNTGDRTVLDTFDVAPIRPEKVQTIEVGYRTTIADALFVDASYYFSRYRDFIGFQIGIDQVIPEGFSIPSFAQAFRVSANASDIVTTQGASIGLSYYFAKYFQFKGNFSWNKLNTATDDPIIPAFNTPEFKYNLGLSARNLSINLGKISIPDVGFSVQYKWIQGFIFEGSPQFTGFVPTYDLVDAQVTFPINSVNTTLKIGASNLLNSRNFQTFGGPRIGRIAYLSVTYDWQKK
jgi:outer membrane receptor protein involved in Fe transport